MAQVACCGLSKAFGEVRALEGVNLSVAAGNALVVAGPSGSGKTTLLRLVAGLERPDAGTVSLDGRVVSGDGVMVAPHRRGLAFLFQRPTLWPHMTALQNVTLALSANGVARRERRERAAQALRSVGMESRLHAWPATLSGGEMQRVALARAWVTRPRLLLLDEPFAGLDADLRAEMAARLADLKRGHGVTLIWVTHRSEDASCLADHTVTLTGGRIVDRTP